MKKTAIIFLLFLCGLLFSQSVTERYNSLSNRYEYYDSSGNLIGYKQYNNLRKQWEYFDVQQQYQRQPRQYGDYVEPYNYGAIEQALRQKKIRHDYNVQQVRGLIELMRTDFINKLSYDSKTKNEILTRFNYSISQNLSGKNFDYSSEEQTQIIIKWIYDTMTKIIDGVTN